MSILFHALWPILFLVGLFVGVVYLVKFIIHRIVDHV